MAKTRTFPTHIDITAPARDHLIAVLNQQLADTFDLQSHVKQAHWNIKGPQFIALHELFDDLAENLEGHVDTIAERAVALGGFALGTARMAATATRIPEYPSDITDGMQHVAALVDRYAQVGASTRKAIGMADEIGDADTADLFTQVSRDLDKYLWFLEAHLQG
ncbi:DNA starvation/stationary phase protection protein Dps [Chloroflexales bacterium ZM16-3]|nr:DNA starvation/stationary phase protection protein Dps [Chloroflexales bacterium ZM16-3]